MFLDLIKIAHILPCLADPEKIRFIAYFDKNVSEVFPYLNAILNGAIYNHEGKTLTIKKEGRLITIHPNKIAAGKVTDESDAHQIISWIKERINYCYDNKDSIEPNNKRRQKLSGLDIYKLLPGTNCRRCEELTCIAFAVKLSGEEISVLKCAELFSGNFTEKRTELLRLLKASGYDVPGVFVSDKNERRSLNGNKDFRTGLSQVRRSGKKNDQRPGRAECRRRRPESYRNKENH